MSSHDVFLKQLAAHPDDDTTRLVYADWLDERGDERGSYLRGEVEMARLDDADPRHAELRNELTTLRWGIAEEWLAQAGKRFDVWLLGYTPRWKIGVIKVIRELTGMGLAEAKGVSESLPAVIVANVPLHTAEAAVNALAKAKLVYSSEPGEVVVRVRPAGGHPGPVGLRGGSPFALLYGSWPYEVVLHSVAPARKIEAIKLIRNATGGGLAECKQIVESLPRVIHTSLPPEMAEGFVKQLAELGQVEVRGLQQ